MAGFSLNAQTITDKWNYEIALHEKVYEIPDMPVGPFVRVGTKKILAPYGTTEVLIGKNEGKSWDSYPLFKNSENFEMGARAIQRTTDGVIILAFYNLAERHFTWEWDNHKLKDARGSRLPTYVVRSLDNG